MNEMLITQIIAQLSRILEEHGDIGVWVADVSDENKIKIKQPVCDIAKIGQTGSRLEPMVVICWADKPVTP